MGSRSRLIPILIVCLVSGATVASAQVDNIILEAAKGPGAGDVTLDWAGSHPIFQVFRSTDPATVLDLPNKQTDTNLRQYVDTPPPGSLFFYKTITDPADAVDLVFDRTNDEPEPPCGGCEAGSVLTLGAGSPVTVKVFLHSGEVMVLPNQPQLAVPSRGEATWRSAPVYRSQILYRGAVGNGWNMPYLTDFSQNNLSFNRRYLGARGRFDDYDQTFRTSPGWFELYTIDPPTGEATFRDRYGTKITHYGSATPSHGFLKTIVDRNGNLLECNRDPNGQLVECVGAMGRAYQYFFTPQGRLANIQDWSGRVTQFQYNPEFQLTSITTPAVVGTPNEDDGIASNGLNGNDFPSGKSTQFGYDTLNPDPALRDNLLFVTFPNDVATGGPQRYVFVYGTNPGDPSTYDRVTSIQAGGGQVNIDPVTGAPTNVPAGGAYGFTYTDLGPRTPGDLVTEFRQTVVQDPNGNVSEYFFNSEMHEVRSVVQTNRGVNPNDSPVFVTLREWNSESLVTRLTLPEGNQYVFTYDTRPDRFAQGNIIELRSIADPGRGGDQVDLVTTYTYDPIYNLRRTITTPRGDDPIYVPPIPDNPSHVFPVDFNLDGDDNDPSDGETTRRHRYSGSSIFDYQEGTAADILSLAAQEGVDLDPDGPGPRTASQVANALSLGGGAPVDANGDGVTNQQAGNVIESRLPNVILPGGAKQEIIETHTYNDKGQRTSLCDPEGNQTTFYYHPETDPDGNGTSEGLVRAGADPNTGGYLSRTHCDDDPAVASSPAADPDRPSTQPVNNSGCLRRVRTAPFTISRSVYTYDSTGNLTGHTDSRGTASAFVVTPLNEIVRIELAASVGTFTPTPAEPLPLTAFNYVSQMYYDYNGNVIRTQVEDRGNTSTVGGDNGATAFVDRVSIHDLLDSKISDSHEVSDALDLVTRFRYDANGNHVLTIKPEGNANSYLYDERDLVFQATRGATSPPPLVLLAAGDPIVYDPRGGLPSVETYSYDNNGNILETADADDTDSSAANNSTVPGTGDRTRRIYDGYDRPTSLVDSVGNQSVTQYDPDGNVVRVSRFGPVGGPSPTADGPDPLGRPVSSNLVIDSGKLVNPNLLAATENLLDEAGRSFRIDRVLFVNTIGTVRTPDVDDGATSLGKGDLTTGDTAAIPGVSGVSIVGRVSTQMLLDRNGVTTEMTEDDLDQRTYAHDGLDRLVMTADPEGNLVEYSYDDEGNVIEMRETDKAQTFGVPDEIFLTTMFYDALGRLQQIVDNAGQSVEHRYDSRGNVVSTADSQGPVTGTTITRRAFGGIIGINDFGNVSRQSYDGLDRPVSAESVLTATGAGDGINPGADLFGVKGPVPAPDPAQGGGDGLITIFTEYDLNSLVDTTTDDNGNRTDMEYDNLDRPISRTSGICVAPMLADRCDPPTTVFTAYDRDHNVAQITDQNGSVISCSHDGADRQVACTIARGPGVAGTTQKDNEYDGLDRPTRASDNNEPATAADDSVVEFAWDSTGRLIEEVQTLGATVQVISSGWRAENLRSVLTYPNSRAVDFSYDNNDRLQTVDDSGAGTIATYEYLGTGRIAQRFYPGNNTRMTFLDNASTTDVGYDNLRRPVQMRHLDVGNSLLTGFAGSFDRMNNRQGEQKLHDPVNDEQYGLDSFYRLVDFNRPNPSSQAPLHSQWGLDGAGNWKQVDAGTRTHTSFDEVADFDDDGDGTFAAFLQDDNGNRVQDDQYTYTWDYANRLKEVKDLVSGNVIATFLHDATGRRVSTEITNSGPLDGLTHHAFDYMSEIEELDGSLGALSRQFVWGTGDRELLLLDIDSDGDGTAVGTGETRLFYQQNALGSIYGLADVNGRLAEGYLFEAYGMPTTYEPGLDGTINFGGDDVITFSGSGQFRNPYRFQSVYYNDATFLYVKNWRWSDPRTGRDMSRNPRWTWSTHWWTAGSPYAPAQSNPTSLVYIPTNSGEKLTGSPVVFGGTSYFTTYTPGQAPCSMGSGRVYAAHFTETDGSCGSDRLSVSEMVKWEKGYTVSAVDQLRCWSPNGDNSSCGPGWGSTSPSNSTASGGASSGAGYSPARSYCSQYKCVEVPRSGQTCYGGSCRPGTGYGTSGSGASSGSGSKAYCSNYRCRECAPTYGGSRYGSGSCGGNKNYAATSVGTQYGPYRPNVVLLLDSSGSMGYGSNAPSRQYCTGYRCVETPVSSSCGSSSPVRYGNYGGSYGCTTSGSGGKCWSGRSDAYSGWDNAVNGLRSVSSDYGGTGGYGYQGRKVRFSSPYMSGWTTSCPYATTSGNPSGSFVDYSNPAWANAPRLATSSVKSYVVSFGSCRSSTSRDSYTGTITYRSSMPVMRCSWAAITD